MIKRNDVGWWLWWIEVGPLNIGIDLANWGLGFLVTFRRPAGFTLTVGPFYVWA